MREVCLLDGALPGHLCRTRAEWSANVAFSGGAPAAVVAVCYEAVDVEKDWGLYMPMNYEELDEETRKSMLSEFEREQANTNHYESKALSSYGLTVFPNLMRIAIRSGNEETLNMALDQAGMWLPEEEYTRNGITRLRRRNINQSAIRLAVTEFSTWYVRGFAARLLAEGVMNCRVYRAEQPKWEPGECSEHEGLIVSVQMIHDNHRVRYWPEPGDSSAFSIPFGPGCHHVIRRVAR